MTRSAIGIAILACFGGCHAQRGDADARAIARAFERFEEATSDDRPEALAALKSTSCKANAEDCADRDVCVEYADALLRATTLAKKAREYGPVDGGGNGAATTEDRAVIVAAAEDAVNRAEAAEPKCTAALDRLHRRAEP